MIDIPIDIVKLKEVAYLNVFISKDDVKNFLKIKASTYSKLRDNFKKIVDSGYYPKECYISIGNVEMFNVYTFLHFLIYRDYFDNRYLKNKLGKKFNITDFKRVCREMGMEVA